jgi:hypothetical protein
MTRAVPFPRSSVRLIASAVACSSVLLAAPAAYADKHVATDAARDVVSFDDSLDPTPEPDQTDADLRKIVVKHTNRRVIIKAKLRELSALNGKEFVQLYAMVDTNEKDRSAVTFKTGSRKPGFQLIKGGKEVACAGVRKKISPAKNFIRMSIPRSCFGNPRWIKVAMASLSGNASEVRYYDEAYRVGSKVDSSFRFTPRLKRG